MSSTHIEEDEEDEFFPECPHCCIGATKPCGHSGCDHCGLYAYCDDKCYDINDKEEN